MAAKKQEIAPPAKERTAVSIPAPNFDVIQLRIRGTSPMVQHRFSVKAREQIKATQEAGSTAKGKKKREPKNFQALYEQAQHKSTDGWNGIPAAAFRNGCISACRVVGYAMTRARLALKVLEDGYDDEGQPLVRIAKGKPTYHESYARNDNGSVDLRARPMFHPGWEAIVRIQFDADMFTRADVANLMARMGMQVGIGEGRNDSKDSFGCG